MSATATPKTTGRAGRFALPKGANLALAIAAFVFAAILPFFLEASGTVMNNLVLGAAYAVMALGLNIIVGFAGLLDLGYVAFYALGAFAMGYGGSLFLEVGGDEGVQFLVAESLEGRPGLHINFIFILILAIVLTTIAGCSSACRRCACAATTSRS
jgi:branched-chain amino acid transport system permease protein